MVFVVSQVTDHDQELAVMLLVASVCDVYHIIKFRTFKINYSHHNPCPPQSQHG